MYDLSMLFSFFFFFKQKTAYEMRISDWSSDVCSSDLASPRPAISARPTATSSIPTSAGSSQGWAGVGETWFQNRTDADAFLASSHVHAAEASQIGRASCRERVCQYV